MGFEPRSVFCFQESVRENGSNLELRCSPERSVTSPPPMSIEALEMENLMMTSSIGRNRKRATNHSHPLLDLDAFQSSNNNNNNNNVNNNNNNLVKNKPSSRIRFGWMSY